MPSNPLLLKLIRSPFVGRNREQRILTDALERALSTRRPQAVTILGSAGMGKTRLVYEFLAQVKEQHREVSTFRGLAQENGPTLGMIRRVLSDRFELPAGANPDQVREIFRNTVAKTLGDRRVTEFLHFLGAFLDVRFPESPFIRAIEDDPEQLHQIGRVILKRFFELDAEQTPLVLTFEDLHWATEDSLSLVKYLLDSCQNAPILFVLTGREDLLSKRPDWFDGTADHAKIELSVLDTGSTAQMVSHIFSGVGTPPPALLQRTVDLSNGSPYIVEQLVRNFISHGVVNTTEEGVLQYDPSRIEDARLPFSIEEAVRARISALSSTERGVLEMASTMGGIFWLGAIVSLQRTNQAVPTYWGSNEDPSNQLFEILEDLAERDYLLKLPDSVISGELEFAFKHNLEREHLLKHVPATQLSQYHLHVAQWLESKSGERAIEYAEILAQHFEAGLGSRRAAYYYLVAADHARNRYANVYAAELYQKALPLLGKDEQRLKMDALHHLGDVLQIEGKSQEAMACFRSMLEIAFCLDVKSKGGAAHNRIGRVYRSMGRLEEAMRHLATGHALFDAAGDKRGIASSLDDVGKVHWMRGDYESSERFIRQALELRQELNDLRSIALSYNNLALVCQDCARFSEALEMFARALELQRNVGDSHGIAQTLNNLGALYQDMGDEHKATELWLEALQTAQEVGDRGRQAIIFTNLGEAHMRFGNPAQAIGYFQEAERLSTTLGDFTLEGEIVRGLAKAHHLAGQMESALLYIERSVRIFERSRNEVFLANALRTWAELLITTPLDDTQRARVKALYDRAIQIFEKMGNDVELSRTYQAYADFLATDMIEQHQVDEFRKKAQRIRERLQNIPSEPLLPLEGEATQPDHPPVAF